MVILTPGFPSSCHGENRPKVRVNTGVLKFYVDEEEKGKGRRGRVWQLQRFSLELPTQCGSAAEGLT